MLTAIIPEQFKDGYMSIKQIQHKKDQIDKIFGDAEKRQETKIQKLVKI